MSFFQSFRMWHCVPSKLLYLFTALNVVTSQKTSFWYRCDKLWIARPYDVCFLFFICSIAGAWVGFSSSKCLSGLKLWTIIYDKIKITLKMPYSFCHGEYWLHIFGLNYRNYCSCVCCWSYCAEWTCNSEVMFC